MINGIIDATDMLRKVPKQLWTYYQQCYVRLKIDVRLKSKFN